MTVWGPSEYLLRRGRPAHRRLRLSAIRRTKSIADANGPGTRLTLSGTSVDGLEKTVAVTFYERHPGIALVRVSYRNTAAEAILSIRSWTNGDSRCSPPARTQPDFWCYSGASYEDRRDWVQPVAAGFAQDNFLGMEASDYGGGTPIVDVWRRDGGLAVGHVETYAEARLVCPSRGNAAQYAWPCAGGRSATSGPAKDSTRRRPSSRSMTATISPC